MRESILPPQMTMPTRRSAKRSRMGDHGGEARGAGALGHQLLLLGQHLHGALQRVLLDQQQLLDQPADDRPGQLARGLDRDALGDGLAAIGRRQIAASRDAWRDRARPRRRRPRMPGFSAVAAMAMPRRSCRRRRSARRWCRDRGSPPAAPGRSCPGRRRSAVVIGVDEDQALRRGAARGRRRRRHRCCRPPAGPGRRSWRCARPC